MDFDNFLKFIKSGFLGARNHNKVQPAPLRDISARPLLEMLHRIPIPTSSSRVFPLPAAPSDRHPYQWPNLSSIHSAVWCQNFAADLLHLLVTPIQFDSLCSCPYTLLSAFHSYLTRKGGPDL